MEAKNDYNYSIFKPVNEYSRRNRNIILSIIVIWAICVFGFQFLLLIFQKPTPEKALIAYESVADNVFQGKASVNEKQTFAGSLLMVLGKTIKPEARSLLDKALTLTVYDLLNDSVDKSKLLTRLEPLTEKRAEMAALKTAYETKQIRYIDYNSQGLELKGEIVALKDNLGQFLNEVSDKIIPPDDAFRHVKLIWLPYELTAQALMDPTPVEKKRIDQVMNLYLVHNQSFLTDFKFLGFPFHYFYTAVFLLLLFVVLCVIYAVRIQHLHRRFEMEE